MMNEFVNASSEKDFLINSEIRKKKIILMGGDVKNKKLKLTPEQIKQFKTDYITMYFAICAVNWCRGGSLGMAWQAGLEQMDSFVTSKKKNPNHPMNEYLFEIHAEHRREMAKEIMTGKHSKDEISMSKEAAKKWSDLATKRFMEKLSAINSMYKKYESEKQLTTGKFGSSSHRLQQIMTSILAQQLNQKIK